MAKKKSLQTRAAETAYKIRQSFSGGVRVDPKRLNRQVSLVVREASAVEAALTFAKVPAKPCYAQARMALLARVLLLPEYHIMTPWYKEKFERLEFLPAEHRALEAYCQSHGIALKYVEAQPLHS